MRQRRRVFENRSCCCLTMCFCSRECPHSCLLLPTCNLSLEIASRRRPQPPPWTFTHPGLALSIWPSHRLGRHRQASCLGENQFWATRSSSACSMGLIYFHRLCRPRLTDSGIDAVTIAIAVLFVAVIGVVTPPTIASPTTTVADHTPGGYSVCLIPSKSSALPRSLPHGETR